MAPSRTVALALLSFAAGAAHAGDYVDPRDGRGYPTVEIAGATWMAENLAFAAEGSFCFDDRDAECAARGRLYPWEIAKRACPPGWHLSTEAEWRALERYLGLPEAEIERTRGRGEGVGDRLKVGGDSGLGIPLAGWRRPDGTYAEGNGTDRAAALWVADEAGGETAWHRDLSSARSVVWRSPVDWPYALSVRCVADRPAAGESGR
jgi:uncharacterized protein (TIGR02145 family)